MSATNNDGSEVQNRMLGSVPGAPALGRGPAWLRIGELVKGLAWRRAGELLLALAPPFDRREGQVRRP
jgi:hypothetical protein